MEKVTEDSGWGFLKWGRAEQHFQTLFGRKVLRDDGKTPGSPFLDEKASSRAGAAARGARRG